MTNATIDPKPLTPNEQLLSPVDDNDIKIIIAGGPGSGKTLLGLKIMKVLSAAMPTSNFVLREDDDIPVAVAKKYREIDEVIPKLRPKKITIYTMQTNKRGVLKGVGQKTVETE